METPTLSPGIYADLLQNGVMGLAKLKQLLQLQTYIKIHAMSMFDWENVDPYIYIPIEIEERRAQL